MGQKIQRENNKNRLSQRRKRNKTMNQSSSRENTSMAQREREMLHKLPESMETNKTITENRAETQTQI